MKSDMQEFCWFRSMRLILAVMALAAFPLATMAAENKLEQNAALGVAYDSNRLLVSSPDEEFYGTRQRAGVKYYSDNQQYRFDSGFKVIDEYLPESRENEVDQIMLDLGGIARGPKSQLNANVSVQKDSTLASEVQATGFVNENKNRLRSSGSLGYTYSLSEIDSFSAGTSCEKVDYDDIVSGQLSEYVYAALNGGYSRAVSDRDKVRLSLFGSDLENQYLQTNSKTTGFSVGWSRPLSEAWSFDASFGRRKSEYVRELGRFKFENSNSSRITDFKLKYSGDQWQYSLLGSYSVQPGNLGELVNRKTIDISAWHPLTDVMGFSGQLRYWQQRSDLTVSLGSDLDSSLASLSLNWRLERTLFLVANLNRIDRWMLYEDDSVYSNGVVFELVWASDPLFL